MIRKGSVKYRRFTNFIWSMHSPVFIFNSGDIQIDTVKECRARLIPIRYSPYVRRGMGHLVDSWYNL